MKRVGRQLPWILFTLVIVTIAATATARPGGGESYSGGTDSSGGGGGGGGGGDSAGLIINLIILCFEYPYIGIPLLLIVGGFIVFRAIARSKSNSWSTNNASNYAFRPQYRPPPPRRVAVTRAQIDGLRSQDPEFSVVLFEDFVYTLYTELHRYRARGNIGSLAAYVQPAAAQAFNDSSLEEVRGVVVGAMRYVSLGRADYNTLEIEFEANYSEIRGGREQRLYVVERLTLARAATAKSRAPARSRTLDCPNCGAPLQNVRGDQCSFCKQAVGGGRFDWAVTAMGRIKTEQRGPALTSSVDEVGNDMPTIIDPGAQDNANAIRGKDPTFDWNQFQLRVGLVFAQLQVAWSSREWLRARPFVSDNLFQSQMYWIDMYIQQRVRNMTENARILRIDLASVISDKHYDAITVRVWATGLDYTMSEDGKLLSGSRSKERAYSEYWTLIRGAQPSGKPTKTTPECPSCGAPLKIAMTGNCEYCKVKVTTGEFDWVLSRIEQDESYGG